MKQIGENYNIFKNRIAISCDAYFECNNAILI